MADVRDWSDPEIDRFLEAAERVINPRALAVCALMFASLIMLNAEVLKSLLFCAGLYMAMKLSLGKRHIERLTVALFILSSLYWIDVGSAQNWVSLLAKKLVSHLS